MNWVPTPGLGSVQVEPSPGGDSSRLLPNLQAHSAGRGLLVTTGREKAGREGPGLFKADGRTARRAHALHGRGTASRSSPPAVVCWTTTLDLVRGVAAETREPARHPGLAADRSPIGEPMVIGPRCGQWLAVSGPETERSRVDVAPTIGKTTCFPRSRTCGAFEAWAARGRGLPSAGATVVPAPAGVRAGASPAGH